MILKKDEIISKVLNNNIILIDSSKKEKIFFEKGIGFGKKSGNVIAKGTEIEKVFEIKNEENILNFNQIIDKIDNKFFAVCEDAIYEISKLIDTELNERIHIGLIDHLFVAIERLKNNDIIENPFLIETQTLYVKEFDLAKIVAKRVEKYSNIKIPDGEVGFIALHIHSSINDGKISNTIRNTQLYQDIVEYVEDSLDIKIDKKSLDYARFCTHIKFAIQRIMVNYNYKNELLKSIKRIYKDSYKISKEISKIIETNLKIKITEDEIASLAIHIERFRIKN